MLQKQIKSDDDHFDLPLLYHVNGHDLHFGRRQFHLITAFKFGMPSFRKFRIGDIIFRDRVFPHKVGEDLKSIDLLCLIEDEVLFTKVFDEDAVRVCLLLSLEVIFMGRDLLSVVDDTYLRMVENFEDWNKFPWGELIWRQLYDAIRNIKSTQKMEYSLSAFVLCFKIWILESSTQSCLWWSKETGVIPRALSWSKNVSFQKLENFGQLFPKDKETNNDLYPTRAEADSEWYTGGIRFFNWYAPRPPPVVHRDLFEDYLRIRAEARSKMHSMAEPEQKARVTLQDRVKTLQDICNGLLILPAEVNSLKARVWKLETIIQFFIRKKYDGHTQQYKSLHSDDKVTDLGDEYCSNLNDNFLNLFDSAIKSSREKSIDECVEEEKSIDDFQENDCAFMATQDRVAAEKQKAEIRRLQRVKEERLRVLNEEEKTVNSRNHMLKAPHMKFALQNCVSKKRHHQLVPRPEFTEVDAPVKVPPLEQLKKKNDICSPYMIKLCSELKPWQEDLERPSKRIDKVFVHRELEDFIQNSWCSRCKFPWSNDIVVDRIFWDCFVGLDANREGWFRDEHIELWVMYLWHFRPSFADWSIVSSYFLTLLLQDSVPLFYANKEVYQLAWADVDRVLIPINEPKKHWSLAQFHIQSGNVIFYDSAYRCEDEGRDWYLNMRKCLEVNLPLILLETGVFDKKKIDPKTYHIKFRLAQNVPKQGGLFGDCGVFVCMFLYRLAYGIPLHVDNPTQAALAYRESLIRYYFQNRIYCA